MTHQFNIKIAEQYGVNAAIVIECIKHWIVRDSANGEKLYEGRQWTRNRAEAFAAVFPYWNIHQIRRTIAGLVTDNILVQGFFNEDPMDRTMWLRFSDDFLRIWADSPILQIRKMHVADSQNGKSAACDDKPANLHNPPISQNCKMHVADSQNASGESAKSLGVQYIYNNTIPTTDKDGTDKTLDPIEKIEPPAPPPTDSPKKAGRAKFVPPTPEEVKAYAAGKSYPDLSTAFLNHYETVGWVYGKSHHPVKSWRAAYAQWVAREPQFRKDAGQDAGPVQQFGSGYKLQPFK